MDQTSIRVLLGSSNQESYWISKLNTSNGYSVCVDTEGSVYFTGIESNGSLIVKYNEFGVIQWQRKINGAQGDSISIDSLNNVYYAGTINDNILIVKYNNSGTIQWQRKLGNTGFVSGSYFLSIDSLDNIYVCGFSQEPGDYILIAKYNTSGIIQWKKRISGPTNLSNTGRYLTFDNSNNPYLVATISQGILIIKLNSSGDIQWQKTFSPTSGFDIDNWQGIVADSSNNIYVSATVFFTSVFQIRYGILIVKYDSSGSLLWQKFIGDYQGSLPTFRISMSIDEMDDIYCCGSISSTNSSAERDILIVKLNSSGVIQWQRQFGSSGRQEGFSIATDDKCNIYICGTDFTSTDSIIVKFPNDGTLTGTYGVFNYSETFLTISESFFIESTSSFTISESTTQDSVSVGVESSANNVSSIITICG